VLLDAKCTMCLPDLGSISQLCIYGTRRRDGGLLTLTGMWLLRTRSTKVQKRRSQQTMNIAHATCYPLPPTWARYRHREC
jgi:hypothetical protein